MAKGTLCSIEGKKKHRTQEDQQNHVQWETPVPLGVARPHRNGLTSSSVGPLARRLWPPSCPHSSNSISRRVARRNGICLKVPWVVRKAFSKSSQGEEDAPEKEWPFVTIWVHELGTHLFLMSLFHTLVLMEMKLILVILAAMQPWWQYDVLFYSLQLVTSGGTIKITPYHTRCLLSKYLDLWEGM